MRDYFRLGFILMLICVIAAGVLGLTYTLTKDQIAKQAQAKQDAANSSALSVAKTFKQINAAEIKKKRLKLDNEQDKIFLALSGGSRVGYTFIVHPRGFGGLMEVAVGISSDGKVKGVSIVSHKETPGLGDQVLQDKFKRQFIGRSPSDRVEVKKDIDAISGATFSSKGLTKGVRVALDYFERLE